MDLQTNALGEVSLLKQDILLWLEENGKLYRRISLLC
jgi:hypothetical protein